MCHHGLIGANSATKPEFRALGTPEIWATSLPLEQGLTDTLWVGVDMGFKYQTDSFLLLCIQGGTQVSACGEPERVREE